MVIIFSECSGSHLSLFLFPLPLLCRSDALTVLGGIAASLVPWVHLFRCVVIILAAYCPLIQENKGQKRGDYFPALGIERRHTPLASQRGVCSSQVQRQAGQQLWCYGFFYRGGRPSGNLKVGLRQCLYNEFSFH